MLKRGMVGFDVSVLQFLLAKRGFPLRDLNSNFGAATEQRVRQFQRRMRLPADGVVGKRDPRGAGRAARSRRSQRSHAPFGTPPDTGMSFARVRR